MCGAKGYILSKKACNIILNYLKKDKENLLKTELYEDKLIGDILKLSENHFHTLSFNTNKITIYPDCVEDDYNIDNIKDYKILIKKYNSFICFYDIYKFKNKINLNIKFGTSKVDLPVYCINLESSVERNNLMTKQFKKYNINYKFVTAIDGNNISNFRKGIVQDIAYNNNGIFTENYILGTQGSENRLLACYLSHIKAIKEAFDDKIDIAIIMEDDISFKYIDKWRYKISEIIKKAPDNWTVLKLHTSNFEGIKILNNSFTDWVNWNNKFFSAGFYVLNRKGMERIIKYYIHENEYQLSSVNNLAADLLIFMIDNEHSTYVYNDYLVINNNELFSSTINDSEWRRKLENQGIVETKKFFRDKYLYINKVKIPKILEIESAEYNYLLTVFLTLEEEINIDLKKNLILNQNGNEIINIDIEKQNELSVIIYCIFKTKIADNTNISIQLF